MNFLVRYSAVNRLLPHSGFAGATPAPTAVGNSGAAGYPETAIARWNVVPYQTFNDTFNVGVVAFHVEGIDHVEFSVNGGPWHHATAMMFNPRTGVVEYWVTLNAIDFADGPLEVRAIAVPVNGMPRLLAGDADAGNGEVSMFLNANHGGTLSAEVRYVSTTGNDANDGLTAATPKLTTNAAAYSFTNHNGDGGTIYLLAGTYTLSGAAFNTNSGTANRWMTITAAPGVARADAIINGTTSAGFNSKLVRIYNVTVTGSVASGGPLVDYCWMDSCYLPGTGVTGSQGGIDVASFTHAYATDCTVANFNTGLQGYRLLRNVSIDTIGGDAFSGSFCVINCPIVNMTQFEGAHTDVWQWFAADNVILYGVDNTVGIDLINSAGPTFETSGNDVAVVNCNLSCGTGFYVLYLSKPETHVYHKNTTYHGGINIITADLAATNVVFEGCTFIGASPPAATGVTVR